MKKLFNEFKEFAFRGNVLDMAIGIMIGGAITAIVTSLVNDIFMPALGLLVGKIDFTKLSVTIGDSTIAYGNFITAVIDFLLVAICIFLVLKLLVKMKKPAPKEEPKEPRKCPYCFGEVHDEATKCMHCGSDLPANEAK